MDEITFLGNAWSDDFGLNITINVEKFKQALNDGKLEINKYGDVRIRVQKLKTQNDRSRQPTMWQFQDLRRKRMTCLSNENLTTT